MNPLSLIITTLLSIPSITAPTDMSSFDASAFAEPDTIRVDSDEGQRRIEAVATVLDDKLSSRDRRYLGSKVLSKSRVTIAKGKCPGGADTLVTVNVNLRKKTEEDPQKYISGVFTLDSGGSLGAIIVPLQTRTERFDLEAVGDVDGDGAADALVTESGDVKSAMHVYAWDGSKSVDHAVTATSS